ncbi:flavodoxin family protein [Candidatus Methanocrinis natronophilus]|uniref:Flavodoxin family protein n=1 Tax=Candidatus Methanocrinis natronophilus TaxID=3033396 RepID=A0ABT5XA53_9EURY|nr:flavodoxin family protein [Candidatus Methanocrinis natronophilus]MDF0591585.1 flavodoxin family protein [Candidatus Methanocrinis natronophilus]
MKLVEAVLAGAEEAGADTKLIDLCSLSKKYCSACAVCYRTGECVHDDDFGKVYKQIMGSDGIVLGSPVYFGSVTAQMKTMIDRMSDPLHCQLLLGKRVASVSTAGSEGHREVEEYINRILVAMGATTSGAPGPIWRTRRGWKKRWRRPSTWAEPSSGRSRVGRPTPSRRRSTGG